MFIHSKLKRRTKLQLVMAKCKKQRTWLLGLENEQRIDQVKNEKVDASGMSKIVLGAGSMDKMPKRKQGLTEFD